MNTRDIDETDLLLQQKRALEGFTEGRLSNMPYYIQELDRKLDMVMYKLDLVLTKLEETEIDVHSKTRPAGNGRQD